MNSADAPVVRLSLASPDAVQNPVPVFHRVLEAGPVIYDPDLGGYVVGHYDDVRAILKLDADFAQHAEFHEKMIGARDFLGMADPEHAEVRSAFSPSFTTSAVRTLESATRAIVDEAVTMSLKSGDFDGVASIGRPVAGGTLAALLHVPSRDVPKFMGWAEDIGRTTEALAEPDPGERARLEQVGIEATKLLLDYAGVLLREQGAGGHHPDLIADFANSAVARQMPAIERQANVARIILGGHDNTWKLIAHLLVEFGRHRERQWHH